MRESSNTLCRHLHSPFSSRNRLFFSGPSVGVKRRLRENSYYAKSRTQSRRQAHTVEIEHAGGLTTLDVEEGDTILESALEAGLDLSHDCKMGVAGNVDQSAGMLDEEIKEKGYALLCVSEPRSDCKIRIIDEDEILEEVLCSSANAG